jgi:hypothetical protein
MEHRPENFFSQSEPTISTSLSRNLLSMAKKFKFWSSIFFVRDGNKMIDISSAAQGPLSTVPYGATQHTFYYPGTAYRFDPLIFHGNTTEFDVNEAEKHFFALMKLPKPIDGCTLVIK